jgi:phage repressor protein C with HTH and peptisase S24 domain
MTQPLVARLRDVMEALSLTNEDVAEDLGTNVQRVKDVLRGKTRFPTDFVVELPRVYHLNPQWWLHGEGEKFVDSGPSSKSTAPKLRRRRTGAPHGEAIEGGREVLEASDGREFVLLPRYDVRVSAGGGSLVHSEQIVDYYAFNRRWFEDRIGIPPAQAVLLEVHGDSMEPDLEDGDLVIVDTSKTSFVADAIYVILVNGALVIKRVSQRMDGKIEIRSSNEKYGAEILAPEEAERLIVVGRARRVLKERRLP